MPIIKESKKRYATFAAFKRGYYESTKLIKAAALVFDSSPISPVALSGKLLDKFHEKRENRAKEDPNWASIESLRTVHGSKSKIFISDKLTFADYEIQQEIAKRLTPDPWWLPVAMVFQRFSLKIPVYSSVHASQRVFRGWDDRATYDLGSFLCSQIADQLDHLAETAHGWPSGANYPTYEDWTNTLREKASNLRRFDGTKESEKALSLWFQMERKGKKEEEVSILLEKEIDRLEAENRESAKQAMRWVAENLEILWD